MPSYSIEQFYTTDLHLNQAYQNIKKQYPDFDFIDLDVIFSIALNNKSLFPNFNLTEPNEFNYLSKWVKSYIDAMKTTPSSRIASHKTSCSDPAIKVIVQTSRNLTEEQALTGEKFHNLYMSAENIQGNLLEEFIASEVERYAWIWCNGNVLRAVDFCSANGNSLLQVKNKSNTENSSSSAIRNGTSIHKWYRLGTTSKSGIKSPRYMWDELNDIINSQNPSSKRCALEEEKYIAFLKYVTRQNKALITDL